MRLRFEGQIENLHPREATASATDTQTLECSSQGLLGHLPNVRMIFFFLMTHKGKKGPALGSVRDGSLYS